MAAGHKMAATASLACLLLLITATQGSRCPAVDDPQKHIVCYYEGTSAIEQVNLCNCTHLIFTNAVTVDGFNLTIHPELNANEKVVEDTKTLQLLFSVNLKPEETKSVLKSADKQSTLLDGISTVLEESKFRGVEVNFDFGTDDATKKEDLIAFLKELRELLNHHKRIKRDGYSVVEELENDYTTNRYTTEKYGQSKSTTTAKKRIIKHKKTRTPRDNVDFYDDDDEEIALADDDEQDEPLLKRTKRRKQRVDEEGELKENPQDDFLIILRISVNPEIIAKKYDLKAASKYIDYFMIPTHMITDETETHLTFHPSRLMGLSDMLNTDSILDLLTGLGATKEKIIVSLPASVYQHELKNVEDNTPRSPTVGEITVISQNKMCSLMKSGNWTVERDEDLTAPYAFSKRTWLAFEDEISVNIKAKYIILRELAGAAIYPIDSDLQGDSCLQKEAGRIANALQNNFGGLARKPRQLVLESLQEQIHDTAFYSQEAGVHLSEYRIVRVVDHSGAVHVIRKNTKTEFECSRQGYFSHPLGCNKFYRCVKFNQYTDDYTVFEYDCPAGLAFDERWEVCVWPGSLPHGAPCTGSSEIAPVPRAYYQCPNTEGYYADPENCRWFFACLDHARDGQTPLTAYEFRCPFGLVFDENTLVCDWPWKVGGCGARGLAATVVSRVNGASTYKGTATFNSGAAYVNGLLDENRASFATIPDYVISGGRIANKDGGVVLNQNIVGGSDGPAGVDFRVPIASNVYGNKLPTGTLVSPVTATPSSILVEDGGSSHRSQGAAFITSGVPSTLLAEDGGSSHRSQGAAFLTSGVPSTLLAEDGGSSHRSQGASFITSGVPSTLLAEDGGSSRRSQGAAFITSRVPSTLLVEDGGSSHRSQGAGYITSGVPSTLLAEDGGSSHHSQGASFIISGTPSTLLAEDGGSSHRSQGTAVIASRVPSTLLVEDGGSSHRSQGAGYITSGVPSTLLAEDGGSSHHRQGASFFTSGTPSTLLAEDGGSSHRSQGAAFITSGVPSTLLAEDGGSSHRSQGAGYITSGVPSSLLVEDGGSIHRSQGAAFVTTGAGPFVSNTYNSGIPHNSYISTASLPVSENSGGSRYESVGSAYNVVTPSTVVVNGEYNSGAGYVQSVTPASIAIHESGVASSVYSVPSSYVKQTKVSTKPTFLQEVYNVGDYGQKTYLNGGYAYNRPAISFDLPIKTKVEQKTVVTPRPLVYAQNIVPVGTLKPISVTPKPVQYSQVIVEQQKSVPVYQAKPVVVQSYVKPATVYQEQYVQNYVTPKPIVYHQPAVTAKPIFYQQEIATAAPVIVQKIQPTYTKRPVIYQQEVTTPRPVIYKQEISLAPLKPAVVYQEQYVTPKPVLYQEEIVTSKPAIYQQQYITPKSVVYQQQYVTPKPVIYQQEIASPKPVVYQQQYVTPKPVIYQQEIATPKPVIYQQQYVTPKPVVYQQEIVTPKPVVYQQEYVTPKPVLYKQEIVTPKPVVYQEQYVTPKPVVYQQEIVTPKPVVYQQQYVTPKPVVYQQQYETPKPVLYTQEITPKPVVYQQEYVTPKPVVYQQQYVTPKPVVYRQQYVTPKPVVYQQQYETPKPVVYTQEVTPKPVVYQQYVTPKPVVYQQEIVTPKPVIYQQQYQTPEQVVYKQEIATPKPVVYQQQYETPKPVVYQQEIVTPKPVIYQQQYETLKPVVYKQEIKAPKPIVYQQYATPKPVVYQQEIVTPKPVVYQQQQYVTPKPVVYQQEVITPKTVVYQQQYETPKQEVYKQEIVTPKPVLYQQQFITPKPVVYQQEIVTPKPLVYEQKYVTPKPVVYQQQYETPQPVVYKQEIVTPKPVVYKQRKPVVYQQDIVPIKQTIYEQEIVTPKPIYQVSITPKQNYRQEFVTQSPELYQEEIDTRVVYKQQPQQVYYQKPQTTPKSVTYQEIFNIPQQPVTLKPIVYEQKYVTQRPIVVTQAPTVYQENLTQKPVVYKQYVTQKPIVYEQKIATPVVYEQKLSVPVYKQEVTKRPIVVQETPQIYQQTYSEEPEDVAYQQEILKVKSRPVVYEQKNVALVQTTRRPTFIQTVEKVTPLVKYQQDYRPVEYQVPQINIQLQTTPQTVYADSYERVTPSSVKRIKTKKVYTAQEYLPPVVYDVTTSLPVVVQETEKYRLNTNIEIAPPPVGYELNIPTSSEQPSSTIYAQRVRTRVRPTTEASREYLPPVEVVKKSRGRGKATIVSIGQVDKGEVDEKNLQGVLDKYSGKLGEITEEEKERFVTKVIKGNGKGTIKLGREPEVSTVGYEISDQRGKSRSRTGVRKFSSTSTSESYEDVSMTVDVDEDVNTGDISLATLDLKNLKIKKNKKTVIVVSQVSDANPLLIGKLAGQCSCESNKVDLRIKGRRPSDSRNRGNDNDSDDGNDDDGNVNNDGDSNDESSPTSRDRNAARSRLRGPGKNGDNYGPSDSRGKGRAGKAQEIRPDDDNNESSSDNPGRRPTVKARGRRPNDDNNEPGGYAPSDNPERGSTGKSRGRRPNDDNNESGGNEPSDNPGRASSGKSRGRRPGDDNNESNGYGTSDNPRRGSTGQARGRRPTTGKSIDFGSDSDQPDDIERNSPTYTGAIFGGNPEGGDETPVIIGDNDGGRRPNIRGRRPPTQGSLTEAAPGGQVNVEIINDSPTIVSSTTTILPEVSPSILVPIAPGRIRTKTTTDANLLPEKPTARRIPSRSKARIPFVDNTPPAFSPITADEIASTIESQEVRPKNGDGNGKNADPSKVRAGAAFDRYGPGGWRGADETLQGSVDCKRPGLFRHPKYCNKFYSCNYDPWKKRYTLSVFNCPVHLAYDDGIGACNWPSKGPACADDNLLV